MARRGSGGGRAQGRLDRVEMERAVDGSVEVAVKARVLDSLDQLVRQPGDMGIAIGGCEADERAPFGVGQGSPLADLGVVDEIRQRLADRDRHRSARSNRLQPAKQGEAVPEGEMGEMDPDGPAVHILGELLLGQGVDEMLEAGPGCIVSGGVAAVHGTPIRSPRRQGGERLSRLPKAAAGFLEIQLPEGLVEGPGPRAGSAQRTTRQAGSIVRVILRRRAADPAWGGSRTGLDRWHRGPPRTAAWLWGVHGAMLQHTRASLRVMVVSMGLIRALLLAVSLVAFLVLSLVANVGLWALSTFLDSDAFAATTARIIEQPQVRSLLAERLAERLTDVLVPPSGRVPVLVRRGLGLTAGASTTDVEEALARAIDAQLADPTMVTVQQDALADLHRAVLAIIADPATGATGHAAITLDLGAVVEALAARLDPGGGGFLGQTLPAGLPTLTLVEADGLASVARVLQILEALRWLLPALCVLSALLVLSLARARLHAVAWLGLCLLLVGAACMLATSAAPLVAGRLLGAHPDTLSSVESTLDGLTGELLTQSAVLAGLGLAMLVAGVSAGIVTGRGAGRSAYDGDD